MLIHKYSANINLKYCLYIIVVCLGQTQELLRLWLLGKNPEPSQPFTVLNKRPTENLGK